VLCILWRGNLHGDCGVDVFHVDYNNCSRSFCLTRALDASMAHFTCLEKNARPTGRAGSRALPPTQVQVLNRSPAYFPIAKQRRIWRCCNMLLLFYRWGDSSDGHGIAHFLRSIAGLKHLYRPSRLPKKVSSRVRDLSIHFPCCNMYEEV
jgi:hypothetical protein